MSLLDKLIYWDLLCHCLDKTEIELKKKKVKSTQKQFTKEHTAADASQMLF